METKFRPLAALSAPPLEFLRLGLTAKNQSTIALAPRAGEGDREAVGEGFAAFARRNNPSPPGFAVPPSERAVVNCRPQ